jgi:hypothetical protein
VRTRFLAAAQRSGGFFNDPRSQALSDIIHEYQLDS